MATMKALVKSKEEPGLCLEDVDVPVPGKDEVLIKIHKTAICGTDVHIYNWDKWAQKTIPVPMVIGHEFVGRIADFGENVHDYKRGDLVSGEGHLVCGSCRNCLAGRIPPPAESPRQPLARDGRSRLTGRSLGPSPTSPDST